MRKPSIVVCVVTCNQVAFIETCLRSILEQQVDAALTILVGDDASDDGTSEIIHRLAIQHPGKIIHLRRDERLGAMTNMRDLMARATGEYIARTDGDDFWLPGKLQRQLDYLRQFPNCAAVYTNAITVDEAGNRIGLFNDVGDAQFDLRAMLRRGNFLNNSSMLLRADGRRAWLDVETPQIDYQVHLWHARRGRLGHIGDPMTAYRVGTQGSMVASSNARVRELYWQAIQSIPRGLVDDDDYAHGITDFLRRVCFRAVRTRDLSMLRYWVKVVFSASPYTWPRTAALVLASVLRMASKLARGLVAARTNSAVLYRH